MGNTGNLHYAKEFLAASPNDKYTDQFNYGVLNSLSCHVCVLNDSGDILAVNDAWLSFGRENNASLDLIIPGNNYLEICKQTLESEKDDFASAALKGIEKVISGECDKFEIEYPCHSPNEQRWFLMQCTQMHDTEKRVVVSHFDISRLKLLENSLVAKENELKAIRTIHRQASSDIHLDEVIRTILQQIDKTLKPDLSLLFLAEGDELKLKSFYPDAEELLEHTQTKHKVGLCLCGLSISKKQSIFALDIHHDPRCTLQECKKAGIRSFASIPLIKNSQIIGCLGVASKTIRDFSKNRTFLESVAEDVALSLDNALLYDKLENYSNRLQLHLKEREQLEEQLIHKHKMEAIGTLSSGIAHDFNNILAAILGYAECAKDDLEPGSEAHNDIEQVLAAGKRATDLIRRILNFSQKRIEQFKPINLGSTIVETAKMLRATIPTTIDIRTEIRDKNILILGSDNQLQQVLLNLFTNAVHAMEREGGVLSVVLERQVTENSAIKKSDTPPEECAHIIITDTGEGISLENIDKIFDPYFTTKKMGKGSGIGLSVVAGIIASHGGEIKVQSSPGEGSSFDIFFPITTEVLQTTEEEKVTWKCGSEHILLVDDEQAIVKLLKRNLEQLGYKVSAFNDSQKALSAFVLAPHDYDLLITDQAMPKLPGHKLLEAVKKIDPSIPVIICTGYNSIVNEETGEHGDAFSVLMKPLNMPILAMNIRRALDA